MKNFYVAKAAHSVDALFLLLISFYPHFPNFMYSLFRAMLSFDFVRLDSKGLP